MNSTSYVQTGYVKYYWSAIFDNYKKFLHFIFGSFLDRKSMLWMRTKVFYAIFTASKRLISLDMSSLVQSNFDFIFFLCVCESRRNEELKVFQAHLSHGRRKVFHIGGRISSIREGYIKPYLILKIRYQMVIYL